MRNVRVPDVFTLARTWVKESSVILRVGIIAHLKHPIAEPFAGGLEMHTHLLAERLQHRGHHITVFASTESNKAIGVEPICERTALDIFGVARTPEEEFFREHHAYLSLMNRLRYSNFDIIHNNSLHYLPIVMADALPMPVVTTLHTPPFKWLESGIRIASNAPRLLAVSNTIRDQWAAIAPIHAVISNGVNLENFAFRAEPDPFPYFVWYGRIVPEKGLHYAIDAARMAGIPLRFAGPILDPLYFKSEICPRMGSDTIYEGHLDHGNLAGLVSGARAFLCTPCWEEPYGLVVAEALACGVPVAAFARGAIPEILSPQSGVLAQPDNAECLASSAIQASQLDRKDCRRRAEAICDAELMIDRYEAEYDLAVGFVKSPVGSTNHRGPLQTETV